MDIESRKPAKFQKVCKRRRTKRQKSSSQKEVAECVMCVVFTVRFRPPIGLCLWRCYYCLVLGGWQMGAWPVLPLECVRTRGKGMCVHDPGASLLLVKQKQKQ